MLKPSLPAAALRDFAGLLLCLLLAAFLLAERVRSGPLPSGDEGSWLAAAAEVAAGRGFTTRWLEYHYLEPYAVPRPDDMRFPALTALLALGMKAFGPSYAAARALVAAVYLAFLAAAWYAVRLRFGPACALLTAWLMALSPLQLTWGSAVYCEGLFGLVLALWLIALQKLPGEGRAHWALSGLLIALLALVRPNGLLLAPGLVLAAVVSLRPPRMRWRGAALGLAVLLAGISPWLVRNALEFGNPLHVGGSAGLLRDSHQESATLSAVEFLARYGPQYPFLRILQGIPRFLSALHGLEEGLEALPLAFAALALLRRRAFFPPAAAWGFALSAAACCYAGYNSWGGVRYFTPFLPFVYAYGLSEALGIARKIVTIMTRAPSALRYGTAAGLAVLAALPVVNPHRFYHRHYSALAPHPYAAARAYAAALDAALPGSGVYLAAELCQINYLSRGLCVGLQGPRREEWLPRALAAFDPGLLALKPEERDGPFGQALLAELDALGWSAREIGRDGTGVLLGLSRRRPEGRAAAGEPAP